MTKHREKSCLIEKPPSRFRQSLPGPGVEN
jgi:hypothetical protein